MAKNPLGGDFLNSTATNTALGSSSSFSSLENNALMQQLEDEAVKILATLARDKSYSGDLAREIANQLKANFGPLTQDQQAFTTRLEQLMPAFTMAQEVGATVAKDNPTITDQELQRITQAVLTANEVLGKHRLNQIISDEIKPTLHSGVFSPNDAAVMVTRRSAETAFTKYPAETARKFMYGQLPNEYLLYGGPAITGMGVSIRRELTGARAMVRSADELSTDDDFTDYLRSDYAEKVTKTKIYLETLKTQFDKTNKELEEATKAGDSKTAAELRRSLGKLSQEILETTKVLDEAEKESENKRRQWLSDMWGATSPIREHAQGALRNPVVGLLKESFKVGVDVFNATSNLMDVGDGGGGVAGTTQNALTLAALWATGKGLFASGAKVLGTAATKLVAPMSGLDAAWNMSRNAGYEGTDAWQQYQQLKKQGLSGEEIAALASASKDASQNLKELSQNTEETSATLPLITQSLSQLIGGSGIGVAGTAALAAATFGGGAVQKAGATVIAAGAGTIAAGANFGLGAIDIGQQYLSNYWQGATGLNMRQYLQLSGGAQNVFSYLGGGVLGTEALRLGFGINDISRGYEVMQRGMPTGGMNAQQMTRVLDENAKIARALGIRLEESLQLTTTMRTTFGTAEPQRMGGYIAALGADRYGNFETAFSKAVAQGFLEASKQMMMQGVAPESSAAGFGALRNVFMGAGQPEYLRTMAETNPQFITSLASTFSGRLRNAAAGGDSWMLGLSLRSGMSFEQMARGGPEATMQILDQLMQEMPLSMMSQNGRLTRTGRELMAKYAAEMGQNPDIFIGYAEASLRGDTLAARRQFSAAYGRGAGWEAGLTAEGVQRSPMYEENMRILQQTTAELAGTTETVMGTITKINTMLLEFTKDVLGAGRIIYESTITTMEKLREYFHIDGETSGRGYGVRQQPNDVKIITVNNEEELEQARADFLGQQAADTFVQRGGLVTIPSSAPGRETLIRVNGTVTLEQQLTSFNPEESK